MKNAKLIVKGSFLSVIYLFLQIVASFLMMPFIIHALGDKVYGIWVIVATFIGYYGLLDLGIGSAVLRFVAKLIGEKKQEDIRFITSTAFYMFSVIGTVICVLTIIIVFFADRFTHLSGADLSNFVTIIIIIGISMGVSFPFRIFTGILNANFRFDLSRYIEICEVVLRNLLVYFILKNGFGIIAMAIINVSVMVIVLLVKMLFAYKIDKNISISIFNFRFSIIKRIYSFSAASFLQNFANILNNKVDSLVIAYFIDVVNVTYYSVVLRLSEYLTQLIYSFLGFLDPLISQKDGEGDIDGIKKSFIFVVKIALFVTTFFGCFVLLYGKQFIVRWLGPDFEIAFVYIVIFFIPLMFYLGLSPARYLLNNTNSHKIVAITNILEGVSNLLISIILVQKYGVIGVAYGTAISMLIFGIFVRTIIACVKIGLNVFVFYFDSLSIVAKTLLAFIIVWIILGRYVEPSYYQLIKVFLLQAVVSFIFLKLFLFNKEELLKLKKVLKKEDFRG